MSFNDPRLAAEATSQSPASPWQPKPASDGGMTATGRDYSGNFARGTVRDGQVVSVETGAMSRGSTAYASASPEGQARPVEYVLDHRTKCRIPLSEATDNSIVRFVGGMEVTAQQARQQGWLQGAKADASSPSPQEQPEQAKEQQEVHPDLDVQPFADRAVDESLDRLISNTGGMEQTSAVNEIIRDGEISAQTLGRLASQLKAEPGRVQEQLAPIMQAFETQARAVMSQGGLNSDDVVAWAQKNQPDALNRAMHRQATMRNTSGYAALRTAYLADLGDSNPEQALAADLGPGITTYRGPKGQIMVRIPGQGEMSWRSAIQAYGPK